MRKCEDCKIILDNDVRHCPKCGKEIASDTASAPDPIMDVPRLLAAANLHKSRSEWDEALSAATDALRQAPRDAEITLTLGSIYEERGMLDEALVWYQMTLELDADSRQGKAGKDRLGMLISARRREAAASPKDSGKRAQLYGIGIAAAVLFLIVVLVAWAALRHRQPTTNNRQPSLTPPLSQPRAARPSAPYTSPPLSGASTTTSAPGTATSLRTKAEQSIRDGLSSAQQVTDTGATIDDVIADPRASVATVTFSVPLKGVVTKDQVMRAAVAITRKTFELHQAVKFVTTRCVVQPPGADGSQVAFVGDIAREAVTAGATDQQLAAAFSHPWWNPLIK